MVARNKAAYPKLGYTRSRVKDIDVLLSKLTPERQSPNSNMSSSNKQLNLSKSVLEGIAKNAGQDRIDSDSTAQILPDIELTKEILVGSILSPKTLYDSEVNIGVDEELFDGEIVQPLLNVITKFFKGEHKIDAKLERWLEEMLFTSGARPILILPENELDVLINGKLKNNTGLESFSTEDKASLILKNRGILGSGTAPVKTADGKPVPGLEHYYDPLHVTRKVATKSTTMPFFKGIEVLDDFNVLKHPQLSAAMRKRQMASAYGSRGLKEQVVPGLEGHRYTEQEIKKLYDKPTQATAADAIRTIQPPDFNEKESRGHPLYLELPIDAVVPVFPEGKPSEHLGYFVLLVKGKPMYLNGTRDYYGEIRQSFKDGQDDASSTIQQVREAIGGLPDMTKKADEAEQVENAFTAIMENDLRNRLMNGMFGDEELDIKLTQEMGRVLLWREMKNKETQVLYVPAELMVYMAFDYNAQGVGRSLLSGSKIIASMRSVLMFAETMAGVNNAIGRKKVSIDVDADDPDAFKTISDTKSMVFEGSRKGFPIGSPDPGVTMDYLDRAGFDFQYNVQGDNLPGTKVTFDDYVSQQAGGNHDLQDRLRRIHISGMKVNPELVDPTQSPEFAVSVVNNNVIMARNVLRKQKIFCTHVSRYIQIFTRHSSILVEALREELKGAKKTRLKIEGKAVEVEAYLTFFINALTASLPSPDNTKVKDQKDAFEAYTDLLDKSLDAYISNEAVDAELLGADGGSVLEQLKLSARNHFIRKWLAANNVMGELESLTQMDGKKAVFSFVDSQKMLMDSIGKAAKDYFDLRKANAAEAGADEALALGGEPGAGSMGGEDEFGMGGLDDGLGDGSLADGTTGSGVDDLGDGGSGDPLSDDGLDALTLPEDETNAAPEDAAGAETPPVTEEEEAPSAADELDDIDPGVEPASAADTLDEIDPGVEPEEAPQAKASAADTLDEIDSGVREDDETGAKAKGAKAKKTDEEELEEETPPNGEEETPVDALDDLPLDDDLEAAGKLPVEDEEELEEEEEDDGKGGKKPKKTKPKPKDGKK